MLPRFDAQQLRTFRWPLAVAGVFMLFALILFGFVYMQAAAYMTQSIDRLITGEIAQLVRDGPNGRRRAIELRLREDPRRVKLGAEFTIDGQRVAGNIVALPSRLALDEPARDMTLMRIDEHGEERQAARAVVRRLPNGNIVIVGRNVDETTEFAEVIGRTLAIGLVPTLGLAIVAGLLLGARTQRRLSQVTRATQRIVAGNLRERLPVDPSDDFGRLTSVINGMLDEIERLVHDIAGVGDDIAHELRTPLTRTRAILERGRDNARSLDELQATVDRAIGGLDRGLAIVTALLRIAEIEHSRRLEGFDAVDPARIVREVADLYQPIAEDRHVTLDVSTAETASVRGDRDLLFEAVANLVDNAIKFTPTGGRVELALTPRDGTCVIRVADSGPGIPDAERETVTRRFYRTDKSRSTPGIGLGLTLVAAIAKLHGFTLTLSGGPGCIAELVCPQAKT